MTSEPIQTASAKTRHHRPYFTPAEVAYLSEKQRGKLSESQEERKRQVAMSFIDLVGVLLGFPRRTTATAQSLYCRFHLFYPMKDFDYHDVTMACMYVSSKLHDTLKKPRDIITASYGARFPELSAKAKAAGGELDMPRHAYDAEHKRLLAIERLVLETICFNFSARMPFAFVIKIGRSLQVPKDIVKLAWYLAVDSHRTLIPLMFPPHVIALGCVYLAALLNSFECPPTPAQDPENQRSSAEVCAILGNNGTWETTYAAHVEDLEDVVYLMLELLHSTSRDTPSSLTTSPATPSSPSNYPPFPNPPQPGTSPYASPAATILGSSSAITRLKIFLREREHKSRERLPLSKIDPSTGVEMPASANGSTPGAEGQARMEGTVRFLFGPPT